MLNDDLEALLLSAVTPRFEIAVRLGNTSARILSNRNDFPGVHFFSHRALLALPVRVDHELWCIDDPGGSLRGRLSSYRATSGYRGACFSIGYYATDHFGDPIVLHRFENRYYVIGERLERVLWPYFVKLFIFLKTLEKRQLFMKAAAVAFGRQGVLIVGRGLGGKTTFVRELCRHGATIITNSHATIDGLMLTGVLTTMRVRQGEANAAPCRPALRDGEILIDPFENSPAPTNVCLTSLCVVDYRPDREEGIRHIDSEDAFAFVEQFSLGLNVYRLEEEMLEFYDHDLVQYGRAMKALRDKLRSLVAALPCYVVRSDIFDREKLAHIYEVIGWPWSNTI